MSDLKLKGNNSTKLQKSPMKGGLVIHGTCGQIETEAGPDDSYEIKTKESNLHKSKSYDKMSMSCNEGGSNDSEHSALTESGSERNGPHGSHGPHIVSNTRPLSCENSSTVRYYNYSELIRSSFMAQYPNPLISPPFSHSNRRPNPLTHNLASYHP